ncbi:hypothetical protein D3C81_2317950 [compost metagenome]
MVNRRGLESSQNLLSAIANSGPTNHTSNAVSSTNSRVQTQILVKNARVLRKRFFMIGT